MAFAADSARSEAHARPDVALQAIEELQEQADAVGRQLYVCGAAGLVLQTFSQLGMLDILRQPPDASREATLRTVVAPGTTS